MVFSTIFSLSLFFEVSNKTKKNAACHVTEKLWNPLSWSLSGGMLGNFLQELTLEFPLKNPEKKRLNENIISTITRVLKPSGAKDILVFPGRLNRNNVNFHGVTYIDHIVMDYFPFYKIPFRICTNLLYADDLICMKVAHLYSCGTALNRSSFTVQAVPSNELILKAMRFKFVVFLSPDSFIKYTQVFYSPDL